MLRSIRRIHGLGLASLLAFAVGCGQPAGATKHGEGGHEDHAHPTAGPHQGELIELGDEEFHAELLHEDKGKLTIYVLDGAAKAAVPIEASEVTINLKHDGKMEQFKLAATPDAGDPSGKSSRFVSTDAELSEEIEHEGVTPQLVVTINGKQYRGLIKHDHDHEGHDHAH